MRDSDEIPRLTIFLAAIAIYGVGILTILTAISQVVRGIVSAIH